MVIFANQILIVKVFIVQKYLIKDLADYEGQVVTLLGWASNKRESKGLVFVVLRDGTGWCQCVISSDTIGEALFEEARKITLEASVSLTGLVVKDERQMGGFELQVNALEIIGESPDYPIAKKEHGVDFLMDKRHLWLRSQRQWAIMRIRNKIIFSIHEFFQSKGFVQMDAPLFTGNACEGTSNLFETDFYGDPAYLSQSGQLYGEAMAMTLGKIYTFGPTFRAEKSKTRRHLSEFWMIEPEMAFYDIIDNMDLAEAFCKYLIAYVLEHNATDLAFLDQRLKEEEKSLPADKRRELGLLEQLEFVVNNDFVRITYDEAVAILMQSKPYKKGQFEFPVEWGRDLQAEHERYLVEKEFKKPVIVRNYPKDIKAFYMRMNDDDKTVAAMDVLFPGIGEVIGGSQREERESVLIDRMEKSGIHPEEMDWYLDLRRFGGAPHSGFGLGFERMVQFITGMGNIRDVIPFPRTPGNAEF